MVAENWCPHPPSGAAAGTPVVLYPSIYHCVYYSAEKDIAYTLVVKAIVFCDFLLVSSSFEDNEGVVWCGACLWVEAHVYLQACMLGILHGVIDRVIYLSSASDVCFGHSLLLD